MKYYLQEYSDAYSCTEVCCDRLWKVCAAYDSEIDETLQKVDVNVFRTLPSGYVNWKDWKRVHMPARSHW